jgi:hypothetical protein
LWGSGPGGGLCLLVPAIMTPDYHPFCLCFLLLNFSVFTPIFSVLDFRSPPISAPSSLPLEIPSSNHRPTSHILWSFSRTYKVRSINFLHTNISLNQYHVPEYCSLKKKPASQIILMTSILYRWYVLSMETVLFVFKFKFYDMYFNQCLILLVMSTISE